MGRIRVNAGAWVFDARAGETLFEALRAQGIAVPSVCGGRGLCGLCRVKVAEGGGVVQPAELNRLTDEERAGGLRLSCQVRVDGDIAVEAPPELLRATPSAGVVERIRDLTHDMKDVRIRLTDPSAMDFKAGQYVEIDVPAVARGDAPVYRAYSIASPPEDAGAIELIIRLVPGGICTTWVFTMLKEGDPVKFNGPYGQFGLTDTDRPMVWVAGGSGMAPFRGMVRHMKNAGIRRPVTFFFGALAKRDLCLVDEFRALEKEMPGLTFIPALSQPAPEDQWDGEAGLITQVVERHVTDAKDVEFYLCGSAGMIDASIKVIKGKNVGDDRIFYDKFT